MPITYRIDRRLRVVLVEWTDVVTREELANHLQIMLADEDAIDCGRSITDTRQARNTSVDFQVIRDGLVNTAKRALQARSWKAAVIVDTPLFFGVARQFQAVSDDFIEMSFFCR